MKDKVGANVGLTIIISVICFYLFHQSGVLENVGMAAIMLNWLPLFIGFGTIVVYFLARLISIKWSWIATLLGALLNIVAVFAAYYS